MRNYTGPLINNVYHIRDNNISVRENAQTEMFNCIGMGPTKSFEIG